jgi:hypothetical protein
MGTAVRSDRRLGGRLHMERPEEARQPVGRVGAAADRAVVQRLAGNPRHHGPVLGEALGRFAEPHRSRHRGGRRGAGTGSHRRSLSWSSGVGSMRCMRTANSSPRRHIWLPHPPAASRMASPARSGCRSCSRSRTRSAVISNSVSVMRSHRTEAADGAALALRNISRCDASGIADSVSESYRSEASRRTGPKVQRSLHPLLHAPPRPRPAPRLTEIRDNLLARILEAEREGWLGEREGLEVSLAGAQDKLAQLDAEETRLRTIDLGMPTFSNLAGRTSTANLTRRSATHQRLRGCGGHRRMITAESVGVRCHRRSLRQKASWQPGFVGMHPCGGCGRGRATPAATTRVRPLPASTWP